MAQRQGLRADYLLTQNLRALLRARGANQEALAMWCGHQGPWLSKILTQDRGISLKDLGKVADFFGLSVSQLFQHGIDPLTERRRGDRRTGQERRDPVNRRQGRLAGDKHPDTIAEEAAKAARPAKKKPRPPAPSRPIPEPDRAPGGRFRMPRHDPDLEPVTK